MSYPLAADVEDVLEGAGITSPGSSIVDRELATAIREFEQQTGYEPFYAPDDVDHQSYPYERPEHGEILNLRGAFMDVTGVRVGVGYEEEGDLLVVDRDYELQPRANIYLSPVLGWTHIKFFVSMGAGRVTVIGRKSRCEELPDDVFSAISKRAAARCVARMPASEITDAVGSVSKIKQGARELTFGGSSSESSGSTGATDWNAEFWACVSRYERDVN